jgi:hypothetical protein
VQSGIVAAVVSTAIVAAQTPGDGLRTARERWTARAPSAYEFTFTMMCDCQPAVQGPVRFLVRSGRSTLVSRLHESRRRRFEAFDTIDKIFALLDATWKKGPSRMSVEYDSSFGYPTWADLDPTEAKDDEVQITVTGFRAVSEP